MRRKPAAVVERAQQKWMPVLRFGRATRVDLAPYVGERWQAGKQRRIEMRMMRILMASAALAGLAAVPTAALAAKAPTKVGKCVATTIKEIGTRLEGVDDSGSAIFYATDTVGVSYDTIPGITHSRVGDKVELCLVSLPENCPAGDDRGKVYAAVNLRTQEFWELPDAEHKCGGA
jgi:hypothetical protein